MKRLCGSMVMARGRLLGFLRGRGREGRGGEGARLLTFLKRWIGFDWRGGRF